MADREWTEREYLSYLTHERHMYAWTLARFGGVPIDAAESRAAEHYPYEESLSEFRGSIFHDEAWHYAMIAIHGNMYWLSDRRLEMAPPEYRRESERFEKASAGDGDTAR